MVQKLFVFGAESADRVPQRHHCLHHSEGLGGIPLPEGEHSIEEEAQIPPVGVGRLTYSNQI